MELLLSFSAKKEKVRGESGAPMSFRASPSPSAEKGGERKRGPLFHTTEEEKEAKITCIFVMKEKKEKEGE